MMHRWTIVLLMSALPICSVQAQQAPQRMPYDLNAPPAQQQPPYGLQHATKTSATGGKSSFGKSSFEKSAFGGQGSHFDQERSKGGIKKTGEKDVEMQGGIAPYGGGDFTKPPPMPSVEASDR